MTVPLARSATVPWDWSLCALGAVFALPALIVIPLNPIAGLALALGVMPAAVFNLPAARSARRIIPVIGVLCAAALVLGSLLTQIPALAVVALFALAVGASFAARVSRLGALVLLLALPLTGIGLSFGEVTGALAVGGLMLVGSVYAWLVALIWPERPAMPTAHPQPTSTRATLIYGMLLGLAGASAAALAYALHAGHVGWAAGSALLVMRPVKDQLILRSIGRSISVTVGALGAALFAELSPAGVGTAIAVAVAVASLAATQTSRWYVAPAFTSFIALTLIMHTGEHGPAATFLERAFDTLLGVGAALLFGAAIPAVLRVVRDRRGRGTAHEGGTHHD